MAHRRGRRAANGREQPGAGNARADAPGATPGPASIGTPPASCMRRAPRPGSHKEVMASAAIRAISSGPRGDDPRRRAHRAGIHGRSARRASRKRISHPERTRWAVAPGTPTRAPLLHPVARQPVEISPGHHHAEHPYVGQRAAGVGTEPCRAVEDRPLSVCLLEGVDDGSRDPAVRRNVVALSLGPFTNFGRLYWCGD